MARSIDRAVDDRPSGPILRNTLGGRMDRHAATRRLKHLAQAAGIRMPRMHPHMPRHTFVTTMLDAGVIAFRTCWPGTSAGRRRPGLADKFWPTTGTSAAARRCAAGTADPRMPGGRLRHGRLRRGVEVTDQAGKTSTWVSRASSCRQSATAIAT
ncbi:tyrosine-type recombinase/integrase [Micromonospora musae]|uniref:tyrosine-type recombinase/integrase n=1 Tax=Micromonospora musae TaxID=1894970 RepID=UPI0034257DDC